jgi:hypothetical protein
VHWVTLYEQRTWQHIAQLLLFQYGSPVFYYEWVTADSIQLRLLLLMVILLLLQLLARAAPIAAAALITASSG